MNQREEVLEIDVWKLILVCLRKWWVIALSTAIGGVVTLVFTMNCITPTYQSTVKIYVNNSEINVGNLSISASDLSASVKLVDVYEVILNTKDTIDRVIERAGLDYEYKDVIEMLKTSAVKETQVFQVTVTSTSPEEAQVIASTIGRVLPDVIGQIIDSADARIVEHAIVPTQRSAPSYTSNTIVGALLAFCLSVLAIVVSAMSDITIKGEEDIKELTDIPILTYIPDFKAENKKTKRYGKNRYGYGHGYGYGYGNSGTRKGGDD